MIQRSPGQFRSFQSTTQAPINLSDAAAGPGAASTWTPGATIIDLLTVTPALDQRWSLQAFGVQGYLTHFISSGVTVYGKIGKIIAALIPNASSQTQSPGALGIGSPSVSPMLQLPTDPTLTVTVWDADLDDLPPMADVFPPPNAPLNNFLVVNGTVQLPQPIQLLAGESLAIGMWMLPSLIGAYTNLGAFEFWARALCNASYSLTYDDGLN